ncbi:MAG: mammalian cell entry protein [Frankiales bacterium]|jgi:phospholipid/cholesterol/gamma-HCH transport system substrate-binding protein|nr:mammalian cell entry protein [Frankiales bacterium]
MSIRSNRRAAAWVALSTSGVLLLSGCKFEGAAAIPLPGGQGTGAGAYKVTVEFPDVLDLVPQSAVKVDDVTVGSVSAIDLKNYTARVVVSLNKDVVLPENARASLRQTSLLGEKFVSLDKPTGEPAVGRLRDGATIGLNRTGRNAEIEEVLGALSLVLNGGSLEQLQVIQRELTLALKGREADVKDLLKQLDAFVGGLDAQKQDIVRALDGLDRLTGKLAAQRQVLSTALRDIPAGVSVLADNREQLTAVLTGLDRLGDVAVRVINASQQNTVADLRALEPILTQLNRAGKDLPDSLELLTTYPFPRTVDEGIKGDYANLFITADINLLDAVKNLDPTGALPVPLPIPSILPSLAPVPKVPTVPTVPRVPLPTTAPRLPVPGVDILAGDQQGMLRMLLGGLS